MLHKALDHLQVADLAREQEGRRAEARHRVRVGVARAQQNLDDPVLAWLDGRVQWGPARNAALLGFNARRRYLSENEKLKNESTVNSD